MAIDAEKIVSIFEKLGQHLQTPTVLCLIGSTPGIASGQVARQTPDMDVWFPRSEFDVSDLSKACAEAGILFNPTGEIDPDSIYIQIVRRSGIVDLPDNFAPESIGRFGNLTVVMPPPEYLAAAKLVRGSETDIEDVVWWIRQRGLDRSDIEQAISTFPNESDRENATENLTFVQLVSGRDWK